MGMIGRGEELVEGKKTFSDDVLKIELSGPDRENLSIIDIPGIFRSVRECDHGRRYPARQQYGPLLHQRRTDDYPRSRASQRRYCNIRDPSCK